MTLWVVLIQVLNSEVVLMFKISLFFAKSYHLFVTRTIRFFYFVLISLIIYNDKIQKGKKSRKGSFIIPSFSPVGRWSNQHVFSLFLSRAQCVVTSAHIHIIFAWWRSLQCKVALVLFITSLEPSGSVKLRNKTGRLNLVFKLSSSGKCSNSIIRPAQARPLWVQHHY